MRKLVVFLVSAFFATPAAAETLAAMSNETLADALTRGIEPGAPEVRAAYDRVRAAPAIFAPLFAARLHPEAIEELRADSAARLGANNAAYALVALCGPLGAAEAESRLYALMAARNVAENARRAMVSVLNSSSTLAERGAAREQDEVALRAAELEGAILRAFGALGDARFRDLVLARLASDEAMRWSDLDYLDQVAPNDLAVSAAIHALWETSSSPALRARMLPRVTAYLAAIAPARSGVVGFAWANQPAAASYTPPAANRFNSRGGAVSIARASAGAYTVTFANLGNAGGGNVQATAYGTNNRHCKIGGWSGGADLSISIGCYAQDGTRADSQFTVLYFTETLSRAPSDAGSTGYLWANSAVNAAYNPSAGYSYNDTGATNHLTRISTGTYDVRLPGMLRSFGTVMVTAYGTDANRCNVASWQLTGGNLLARVRCFTAAGAIADSRFTFAYVDRRLPGLRNNGTSIAGAYVWANLPTNPSYTPSPSLTFNSLTSDAGAQVVARRTAIGSYEVELPRAIAVEPELLFAVAYGLHTGHCKSSGWGRTTTTSRLYVRCFNAAGSAADLGFSVVYLSGG